MALYNAKELREEFLGSRKWILEDRNFSVNPTYISEVHRAERLLTTISESYSPTRVYDIFLSHSSKDAVLIFQLYRELRDKGLTVYIDWIHDPLLNRAAVTPATADTLRRRMRNCKSFLLAHSSNSTASSWVQWELGFADGQKGGRVAILPIQVGATSANFHRQEYLGLYPYLDKSSTILWINGQRRESFTRWLGMANPTTLIYS